MSASSVGVSVPDEFTVAARAYKYVSPNLSLFEYLFLNDFWGRITEFYPFWLAPNIITLIGGCCALSSYILLWVLSPEALGTAPSWAYFVAAGLFFTYQTLDGSDGKQARRTGSGSALGELMDHGVDAVVTGFLGVVAVDALGFGFNSFAPWVCIFGAQMAFFLSNLTLLHRGRQVFFTIDIMELQWVVISTLIITGVMGSSFWATSFTLPNTIPDVDEFVVKFSNSLSMEASTSPGSGTQIQARFIIALGSLVGIVSNFIAYTFMALSPYVIGGYDEHIKKRNPGTGVIALFHQLFVIISFGFLTSFCRYRIQNSSALNEASKLDAIRALIFASCYCIGDIMDRFLIMRVAQEPVPLVPPSLAILTSFAMTLGSLSVFPELVQFRVWWGFALIAWVAHFIYFFSSGSRLARALDIHAFRVKDWERKQIEARSKKI